MKKILIIALIGFSVSSLMARDLPDKEFLVQKDISVFKYEAPFMVDAFVITSTQEVTQCLGVQTDGVLQNLNFQVTDKIFVVDHGLSFRIVDYENLQNHIYNRSYTLNKRKFTDQYYKPLDKVPIKLS